jgi:hypothetical protein
MSGQGILLLDVSVSWDGIRGYRIFERLTVAAYPVRGLRAVFGSPMGSGAAVNVSSTQDSYPEPKYERLGNP